MEHSLGRPEQYVQLALWAAVVLGGCRIVHKHCRKGKGESLTGLSEPSEPGNRSSGAFGAPHNAWGIQDDWENGCVGAFTSFTGHHRAPYSQRARKAPASIMHSSDSTGHPVAIITKPMLLARMEAESGAVTPTIARRSRLRSLTGIKDVGRLTEVMEQTLIPLTIRELSPNGLTSSGLMTHFDQHLCASLLDNSNVNPTRLSEFTGRHTFRAVTGALFGPTFSPSAFEDYALFVNEVERIDGSFSSWIPSTRRLQAGRRRLMNAFANYLEEWWYADGLHTIPGISPLAKRLLCGAKDEELDLEEACGGLLAFLCDAHMNLWSTSFGLMSQILSDLSTHQIICEDVRTESTYYFSRLLESVTQEALRWLPGQRPERHLDQDALFTVDGVQHTLKNGTRLVLDFSGLHFDGDVYSDPRRFEASRFLDDAIPLPRPFGEGKRMCKGAYLAKLQLKSFLYHVFRKCDIKVTRSGSSLPGDDLSPYHSPSRSFSTRPGITKLGGTSDFCITARLSGI